MFWKWIFNIEANIFIVTLLDNKMLIPWPSTVRI